MASAKNYDYLVKIVSVGDLGVGKSSIEIRFVENRFSPHLFSTIGCDLRIRFLKLGEKIIKLQIFHTQGQERFNTLPTAYYRGARGILVVYDVTNEKSFHNISKWMRKIEEHAIEDVEKILVANKCDLEEERVITKERGEMLAQNHGIRYVETSALTGENIEQAFTLLTQDILNKVLLTPVKEENMKDGKDKKKRVNLKGSSSPHKSCCCH
ncbi:hypothetical protein ACROYT_G023551 [Oculina patagonica]